MWAGFANRERAIINLLLSALILVLYCAISTPVAQSAMGMLYKTPALRGYQQDTVALECAVNWQAAALPDIMQTLRERNISITFFITGQWADENKLLLRQIAADGHEIGLMSDAVANGGTDDADRHSIAEAAQKIARISGTAPTLYYTNANSQASRAAQAYGLQPVACTLDLLSGRGSASDILTRALDRPFDGSIVLMQPTANLARALPAVLEGLAQQGFRVTTVSRALGTVV